MKGYKAFNNDWTCRGVQYKVGEKFSVSGKIELCGNGIHFCKDLRVCYEYYPFSERTKIAEVVASGDIVDGGGKCACSKIEVVRELSWRECLDLVNTGKGNAGRDNSGDYNSGHHNSGHHNSGYHNSGYHNSGHHNSGYHNSGYYNSGRYNSGDFNSGDCNSDQPTVRLFNHDSGWTFWGDSHSRFRETISRYLKPLCEWVSSENMSEKEKKAWASHETTGGYLRVNEEMFNGKDVTDEDLEFLESVPNFDAEILLECTGIDITNKKKKIVVDGKEIMISKESFEEIKKQFME